MPISSPIPKNAENDENAEGDGPNNDDGNRVEPEGASKEKNKDKRDGTTTHTAKDLKADPSFVYHKPSTSAKSGKASSTQESIHDSDGIPEAEAGGPDILSVSSTSKLSASLGVQEEEFTNMQKSDPAGTLRLLLSKKQSQANTFSDHTTSDSAPSNADINSIVRQDSLLLKLSTDFAHKDVLKQLEENPACAYSHLAFLKKLHNPLTDEATLGRVLQLGSIIDQFAKPVQKRSDNDTRLATQQQAQAMFFEKEQKAQAEVDRLSSQANEGNLGVENCNKNIAFYKQQITLLENPIVGYRRKIIEEEVEKAKIEQEAKASTQELIDAQGREGIQAFSAAEVVAEEIRSLESSNLVVEKELTTLKKIYAECTRDL
jgi:hypothetical protein